MRSIVPLLLCAFTLSAQQPGPVPVEAQVYVTAIDVIADVRDSAGKLPSGLTPGDFILIENGVERKVIGVDYLRAERAAAAQPGESASAAPSAPSTHRAWQTVLYFETDLSNGRGRKQTAKELSKHADKLVQMGTVDVIFADPRPVALLLKSRDAEAVRKALETVASSGGVNQLALHRLEFLSYAQSTTQLEALKATAPKRVVLDLAGRPVEEPPVRSNMAAGMDAVEVKTVRPYVEQEVQLVNRFRRNLITWLSNYSRYAPRTLVMVTDGYDLDPVEYYSSNLKKADEMELRNYVAQSGLSAQQRAAFSGVVRDESGAPLPGVSIAMQDEAAKREVTAVTDVNGEFHIASLNDGIYRLEVTLLGFEPATMEHLQLKASEVTRASVALSVDSTTFTIIVGALAAEPNMNNSGTSTTFTQDFISKLPH